MSLQLKPTECFDKQLSDRIRFSNQSDALLARLVLTEGLDSSVLDLVLSIIHNPAFNTRDVSFASSGDIYAHVANERAVKEFSFDSRLLAPPKNAIPEVVLDGMFDILKADLLDTAASLRLQPRVLSHVVKETDDGWALTFAVRTLAFCNLVHSSWLLRARRVLGAIVMSRNNPLLQTIRNPCFGPWTREMHLTLRPHQPVNHLITLVQRIPNLRFVWLDLSKFGDFIESNMSTICQVVSSLRILEELDVCLAPSTKTDVIDIMCKTPPPSLKVLRFVAVDAASYSSFISWPLPSTSSMPKLQFLHMQREDSFRGRAGPGLGCLYISHLEWMKDPEEGRFVLNALTSFPRALAGLVGDPPQMADYERTLLSEARRLTVKCVTGCEEPALADILETGRSVERLSIRLYSSGVKNMGLFGALRSMARCTSELCMVLPPVRLPEDYGAYDEEIRAAFRNVHSQSLRRLRVFISFHGPMDPGKLHSKALGELCFPSCRHLCAENNVAFECTDISKPCRL